MSTERKSDLYSLLLLLGSYTFAFLLGELVHEYGHYFAHFAFGSAAIQVHIDPFGGSHIVGVNSLPLITMGITSLAGPLLNVLFANIVFLLLFRKRCPLLLPLLIWGPLSLVQEGVTFSLGLLTPGGDASWVARLGIPSAVILTTGILFLLGGIFILIMLLPTAGVAPQQPFVHRLVRLVIAFSFLMLVRALHAIWLQPSAFLENFIPLFFTVILSFLVVGLQRPLTAIFTSRFASTPETITLSPAFTALVLGAGMFFLQIIWLG
jgi:uncharacterized membrane protein YozB (DUF420 family)